MESKTPKFFYAVSLGLELGFFIALPLVFFLFSGIYLDKKFDTMPLFIIVAILLNLVVTVFEIKKMVLPFLEKRSRNKPENIN